MTHGANATRLSCLAMSVVLACTAHAATIRVPQDEETIQLGLAASASGDTVLVAPGVYYEHALQMVSGVSLVSESGDPADTVIDGSQLETVVECFSTGDGTRVEGLTIRNGVAPDGNWPQGCGGGMLLVDSATTVENCVFANNNGFHAGGGIYAYMSSPTVIRCTFLDNRASYGGGMGWHHGSPQVRECTFVSNDAWLSGGGGVLSAQTTSGAVIADCVFDSNTSALRGGGVGTDSSSAVMRRCTFSGNEAPDGSAVGCWGAQPRLEQCTIADSRPTAGSAVECVEGSNVYMYDTIIAFTVGGSSVDCEGGAAAVLSCSDVFGNEGGDWVGGIAGQLGLAGNISEDPLFCRELNPVFPYTLSVTSPCAPEQNPGCGLIGAWDAACGETPVEVRSWGRVKAMYR